METLDGVMIELAHPRNYNPNIRNVNGIKYIVMHYTGNVGDTAKNNADYYARAEIMTSAHFFVSEKDIYQSVPIDHTAYAVGLGKRTEPYYKWPPLWKKATNTNSISIEMCGSKDSIEASETTKETACKLAVTLMKKYGLTPSSLCRHYDITGKKCPAWAVNDPGQWLEMRVNVNKLFYDVQGDNDMLETEENYKVFKNFMNRFIKEQGELPATWEESDMAYCEQHGIINNGRPKSYVTRGELAAVIKRINEK